MRVFKSFISYGISLIKAKFKPVDYARSLGVSIGRDVKIFSLHPGAFGSEPYLVTIGDGVILTANVKFITHDGSTFIFRKAFPDLDVMGPIRIGDNTFIGSGSTILPGVSIGKNCVIGAMSVVTRPIPDDCVAVGAPAKVLGDTNSFMRALLEKNAGTGALSESEKRLKLQSMVSVFDEEGREWLVR